jgi:hypothetical protein
MISTQLSEDVYAMLDGPEEVAAFHTLMKRFLRNDQHGIQQLRLNEIVPPSPLDPMDTSAGGGGASRASPSGAFAPSTVGRDTGAVPKAPPGAASAASVAGTSDSASNAGSWHTVAYKKRGNRGAYRGLYQQHVMRATRRNSFNSSFGKSLNAADLEKLKGPKPKKALQPLQLRRKLVTQVMLIEINHLLSLTYKI